MSQDSFKNCNERFFDYYETTCDSTLRTPELLRCDFDTAFLNTLASTTLKCKPFFVYLHDSNNDLNKLFFKDILCNEIVSDYLINENWPIWPVDVSNEVDRSALFTLMKSRFHESYFFHVPSVPTMYMFIREGLQILPGIKMAGTDLMTIVSQLYENGESFKVDRDMRIELINSKKEMKKVEDEEKQRKRNLAEEEKMKKTNEDNEARERLRLENLKKQEEEEMATNRQKQIDFAKAQVKDVIKSTNNFMIRFRKPNGENITREFSESQTINDVIYFVESMGLLRSENNILFSHPFKNMCEMNDVNLDLGSAGVLKREVISIQMKK